MKYLGGISVLIIGVLALAGTTLAPNTKTEQSTKDRVITLAFVGDIMLDRYIRSRTHPDNYNTIASDFASILIDADITAGNLEGPITDRRSVSETATLFSSESMRFTFAPESVAFLTAHGFNVISLGNNHSTDYGKQGIEETIQSLNDAGVAFVGNPYKSPTPHYVTQNDVSVAFISYNQFSAQSVSKTVSVIKNTHKTADHVIVLAHWGEEYERQPTDDQRILAHRFVDAGANIIIGSHPHVIQSTERYNDAIIYYSLGNFVFDQYWTPNVRCGLVPRITLNKTNIVSATETTSYLEKNGRTVQKECRNQLTDHTPITDTTTQNISDIPPSQTHTGRVTRVIDGDTIKLANGETIRYIGIDTPETVHPEKPPECYGREASAANKTLVEGKRVTLERDVSNRDTYGRLLRYVYVSTEEPMAERIFVNEWLVQNGYAHSSTYPPDVKHQTKLVVAEQEARENKRGAWSACDNHSVSSDSNGSETLKEERGCNIKGNISHNDGKRIYHLPDCEYYEPTVINEDAGERWFCTEKKARKAGWRKALNCPS